MKIAVIGGGAAGLMAAWAAAEAGASVTLFEKNEKCGKKIYNGQGQVQRNQRLRRAGVSFSRGQRLEVSYGCGICVSPSRAYGTSRRRRASP